MGRGGGGQGWTEPGVGVDEVEFPRTEVVNVVVLVVEVDCSGGGGNFLQVYPVLVIVKRRDMC